MVTGWDRLGIAGLSRAYLSGQLSPSAVLDDALARIASTDGYREALNVILDGRSLRRPPPKARARPGSGRNQGWRRKFGMLTLLLAHPFP